MLYVLIAIVCAAVWFVTQRITDRLRRVGTATATIGLLLAGAMWWMAFPFLILAVVGVAVVGMSYFRERRTSGAR